MAVDREAIMAALFTRLQSVAGIQTSSRVFRPWDQVSPAEQPALFLVTGNQTAKPQRKLPTVWTLQPTIYLYVRHDADPTAAPGTALNQMIQAVAAALERTPTEAHTSTAFADDPQDPHTTLGGLVNACYISGTIETDEGLMQNQGVAIIPLEIVTTD